MESLNGHGRGGMDLQGKEANVGGPRAVRSCDFFLRVLGLGLTMAAAVVLGVAKETEVVPIQVAPNMPPLNVSVPAKWHYHSAFVFFVVSNSIACSYAALSLLLTMASGGGKKGWACLIIALDLLMVGLVASSSGAAAAVGILSYHGNSHVGWHKVCNVYDKFCRHIAAAVVLSVIGAIAFLLMVGLAALRPYKISK